MAKVAERDAALAERDAEVVRLRALLEQTGGADGA